MAQAPQTLNFTLEFIKTHAYIGTIGFFMFYSGRILKIKAEIIAPPLDLRPSVDLCFYT